MLEAYRKHIEECANEGLPPLSLDFDNMAALIELLKHPPVDGNKQTNRANKFATLFGYILHQDQDASSDTGNRYRGLEFSIGAILSLYYIANIHVEEPDKKYVCTEESKFINPCKGFDYICRAPPNMNKEVGKHIKKFRQLNNISQIELAKRCEISVNYLSQIESSRKFPSLKLQEKICSSLNISMSTLYENDPIIQSLKQLIEESSIEKVEKSLLELIELEKRANNGN